MAFWNDLSRFAGNITGGLIGESDEERKKKEELKRQAAAQARAQATASATSQQNRPSGTLATTTNANRPTNAVVPTTKPVGITNEAVRATPKYSYKQRADKGYDFYEDDQKVDKQVYLKGTGEDDNKLTYELARNGDRVSAQRVLDTVKGGLFRGTENDQRTVAQRVVDEAKRADEEAEKAQKNDLINKTYDSNFRLQTKGIGVKDYIDEYSGADAWRQQRIRDELARETQIGDNATEGQKAKAQEAALLIAALEEKGNAKFDLAQKGVKLGVDLISGIQRGGATVLDTGLMAKGALGSIGKNDEELVKYMDEIEQERNALKENAALDGFALNDKEDFQWTGNFAQDAANLAGRGLDVGLSATMFANPAQAAKYAAMSPTAKTALMTTLRDSAFFGAADATQGGLSGYGATGELDKAMDQAIQQGAMSAVTQGALGTAATGSGVTYRTLREKFNTDSITAAEAQLGRPLSPEESLELSNGIKAELDARVERGEIPADNPGGFDELTPAPRPEDIADTFNPATEVAPILPDPETPGIDNRAVRTNNLGLENMDARERFGQGRDLTPTNPETVQVLADQEINARVAQLPDDNYIQQMSERFGVSEAALRRLMAQTSKSDLFRKLNDAGEFIRTANSPDAAATSVINKATDAGRAAAARAGVSVAELQGKPTDPVIERVRKMQQEGASPDEMTAAIAEEYGAATGGQTTTDSEGRLVDTTNGEIVFDPETDLAAMREMESRQGPDLQEVPKEPATAQSVAEQTKALPDSRSATGADIPRIKEVQNATVEQLNNFETATTPEVRANLMREIAEHERTGAQLSAESKAMYDEYIRPVVDSLYDKSRRAGSMGRKQYYLPEEIAGTEAPAPKKYGNTWADEANMEFGHSMRREGKIDATDLNDPATALKNYTQQWYQDNYGHLTPENIAEAEGRGAVDGAAYVTGRRNVAEKLDESMVRGLGDNKGNKKQRVKDTLAIATDIRRNADATLDPASITRLKGGISSVRAVQTNRKVAQKIEAGNGETVYERFGMRQFENAQSLGNDAFEQTFTKGMTRDEYAQTVRGYYEAAYQRDFAEVMSPERFDEILEGGISRSYRTESAWPLARVEQELAMEKAIYASEHIRYSDKATQNYVDYEVGHLLRRGKMPSTIGRTVANNISRTFYSGALGLNPLSAIQNFTELSRVAGLTATKDTLKTIKAQVTSASPKEISQTLKSYGVDSNRIRQEMLDEIPTQQKALRFAGKFRDKVEDTVMVGFNATETLKNFAMIKALEVKHADIADPRARREAIMDDFNANSLIGGHYGNLLGVDRSNAVRVAMQFGTYTLRDWGQIADRAKAGDIPYVARVLGTKAALAIPMYTLFGTSLAYTLGINEFKGGPAVSLTTELINSIIEENNRVESETEDGKKAEFDWGNVTSQFSKKATPLLVPGGNYMFNKLGVQDAIGLDPDNQVFREDTFIADQKRGYNENKNDNPRFAAAQDPMSVLRGIVGGTYNTDEAREYFGKDFWAKPQLFGLFDRNTQKNSPAYGRFQDKIEGQSKVLTDPNATKEQKDVARATIRDTFDKAYAAQDLKNEFFTDNPEAASIYKEMTKATYNKETGKRESDVITPEKWKYVESDKSGKLFDHLKKRAEQNNKNFGDPIDPIYTADLTEAQRKEILNLRSSYTGDDKERKSMLYEQEWYNDFQGKMTDYYSQMNDQTFDESSDYGNSKRKTEYVALQTAMPQRDDLYKQYQALRYGDSKTGKAGDEEAGKAFYKANADALNAANEKYQKENFEWTNKMRVLEGATPLTWESFTNDTYGYKSGGSGNGFKPWGSGGSSDSKKTGVAESLTNYGSKATGPVKLKLKQNELVDVTKVVKQPQRATKKANIRITI